MSTETSRYPLLLLLFLCYCLPLAAALPLPASMLTIMQQQKYQHASWGIYVKDADTGEELFDYQADRMFLPGSTTKLFSTAALLDAYGADYRFTTPVFALGPIEEGILKGNLLLVAQGDLTMGGRMESENRIAFTKLDHIYANQIPGAIPTAQDPLYGLNALAREIKHKGIKQVDGDVLIDTRLFQTSRKRGLRLSPIMINENLIDLLIHPTSVGQAANVTMRPKIEGTILLNNVITVSAGSQAEIQVRADKEGKTLIVKGQIPQDQKELLRTFAIQDPAQFAKAAFIQALRAQGIAFNLHSGTPASIPERSALAKMQPIAEFISPPLSEYVKLILKVSHNLGADLIAPLLAVKNGQHTFEEGMLLLGHFVEEKALISKDAFVFLDAAGGDGNRVTPKATVQLLDYMRGQSGKEFDAFYHGLPILGVDGSLADFGKTTAAAGKVRAKTGTGVSFNLATGEFFLTTQALGGYVEAKNGHLLEFMIVVNNASMPKIEDISPIFEDLSQMASLLYEWTMDESGR